MEEKWYVILLLREIWFITVIYFFISLWLPGWLSGKQSVYQCRRHRRHQFDRCIRKSPWGENGNPLQYSCLKNPMDRGAWWAAVHKVTKSRTQLSDWACKFLSSLFFFALMCCFCLFNILLFLLIYEKIYTIIISLKISFLMTAFGSTQWMHHGMLRPPLLNIYVFSLRPLTMKSFTHKAFSVLRVVVEILVGKNILRTFIHMAKIFSNGILHFEFPVAISKHPHYSKPYSFEILSQVVNRGHPKPRRRYHVKPVLHCGGSLPTQPLFLVATFWGPFPQTFGEKKRWSVCVGKAWGF